MQGESRMARLRAEGSVIFKEEDMEAYLNVPPPQEGSYRTSELLDYMAEKGVIFGIVNEGILEVLNGKYYSDVLVAKGIPKEDGADGWFEFLVDVEKRNEPTILPDGSVDYRTLGNFTLVNAGDELVKYRSAIQGKNGKNVRGVAVNAYRGKEKRCLSGKGFVISEDKHTYTAAVTGKVEYINDKLIVSNLLEIAGDVDYISGDIDFAGDVLVHGNVISGMTVKATGKIDIMGHVEGAFISAGREVVLHNGMQGAGKGSIFSGSDVSGKFFEQISIKASGNINANSILECNIDCDGIVEASGKFGMILGGNVKALQGIKATIIGNVSGVKTDISVGAGEDLRTQIVDCDKRIKELGERIEKINEAVNLLNIQENKVQNPLIKEKKIQLMRAKIAETTSMAECNSMRERLSEKLNSGSQAVIVVTKRIYPNTNVTVCGVTKSIKDMFDSVTIKKKGAELAIFSNS